MKLMTGDSKIEVPLMKLETGDLRIEVPMKNSRLETQGITLIVFSIFCAFTFFAIYHISYCHIGYYGCKIMIIEIIVKSDFPQKEISKYL